AGGAAGAPAPAGGAGSTLELVNLAGGTQAVITDVSEYAFDDSGDWIALAISTADQVGNSLQLRQLSTGITKSLDVSKASYRRIVWGDSTDAIAALRVVSDTAGGDEDATVVAWSHAAAGSKAIEISAKSAGISGGLVVSSDRALEWGDGHTTWRRGRWCSSPMRACATSRSDPRMRGPLARTSPTTSAMPASRASCSAMCTR
ncbi:hypothetical protein EBR44_08880, partial [bacterium]|nr:hypothetical protein [bacterium]